MPWPSPQRKVCRMLPRDMNAIAFPMMYATLLSSIGWSFAPLYEAQTSTTAASLGKSRKLTLDIVAAISSRGLACGPERLEARRAEVAHGACLLSFLTFSAARWGGVIAAAAAAAAAAAVATVLLLPALLLDSIDEQRQAWLLDLKWVVSYLVSLPRACLYAVLLIQLHQGQALWASPSFLCRATPHQQPPSPGLVLQLGGVVFLLIVHDSPVGVGERSTI